MPDRYAYIQTRSSEFLTHNKRGEVIMEDYDERPHRRGIIIRKI